LPIKDILIYVDATPASEDSLALAADLAQRFEARLTGVGLADDITAEELFRDRLDKTKVAGDWRPATTELGVFVTRRAKACDLVVLGQPVPGASSALGPPEDVILGCGRPVLVVPHAWRFLAPIGAIALVAWNASREVTRALHDALPLLAGTTAVTVFSVHPDPDEDWLLDGELVRHLARHGLEAVEERVSPVGMTVAEAVIARMTEVGADFLVMGAYGHSRLREIILGSTTRDILREMKVPVLMSH
jgi:nucleotide-binding universal stress UspA family protein